MVLGKKDSSLSIVLSMVSSMRYTIVSSHQYLLEEILIDSSLSIALSIVSSMRSIITSVYTNWKQWCTREQKLSAIT